MKPFVKSGLGTGLLSGCWNIGCFSLVSWLNLHFFNQSIPSARIRAYSGLLSIIILITGIYWGMKETKKKNGGEISYGKTLTTGVFIACITAVIVAAFSYLYCTVINPGYADFMVNEVQTSLLKAGKTTAEISMETAAARKTFSTPSQVIMALVGQSVLGTVVSLIIAFFISRKKNVHI